MQEYNCLNKCCSIKNKPYINTEQKKYTEKDRKKAGVFIYDPKKKSVLLIQSRGQLWGPPKGTFEKNESELQCAIREVLEETGLDITKKNLYRKINIKTHATYFYLELDQCHVKVQDIKNNDANSITWIKTDCLLQMISNKKLFITQHCRLLFKLFLKINIP